MLSTNHAKLMVKVLALLLIAAISFFYATSWITDRKGNRPEILCHRGIQIIALSPVPKHIPQK